MREALCFLFLILLIFFGWNQSFEHHYRDLRGLPDDPPPGAILQPVDPRAPVGVAPMEQAPAARVPAPEAKSKPNWLFDKTKMDEPSPASGGTPHERRSPR